jgi:hypothetical protein
LHRYPQQAAISAWKARLLPVGAMTIRTLILLAEEFGGHIDFAYIDQPPRRSV